MIHALGLMSGTSGDGVDVAFLTTDGESKALPGPGVTYPYLPDLESRLYIALQKQETSTDLEKDLTLYHAWVVRDFLQNYPNLPKPQIIGFHGQTLWHKPKEGRTCQIGDGTLLAKTTGYPVAYQFRKLDMRAGGQGAPLAPIYHQVLGQSYPKPLLVLNIGGVSNGTYIDENSLLAGDIGPGCALLNDWIKNHTNLSYDKDGTYALQGKIHQLVVNQWLENPFFGAPFPKSLDRNHFKGYLKDIAGLTIEDGAATLVAFTTQAIQKASFPLPPKTLLIAGGGAHHPLIRSSLPKAQLLDRGDFIEAELMAYLAVRHLKRLPLTFPGTTGVATPTLGGVKVEP